jgi:hypothetical protein
MIYGPVNPQKGELAHYTYTIDWVDNPNP